MGTKGGRHEPVPSRDPWERFTAFATSNKTFMVLFAIGAALRLIVQVTYHPALMLQRDTYTYLSMAVNDGEASGLRPLMYPLLMKPLLIFDNLAVVTVVQHLAGLAAAVLLYLVLRRHEVQAPLAALGTAPLLLDGYQLNNEHYILAEAFFGLFIVGGLSLLAWNKRPLPAVAAVAGLVLGLAFLMRFVGIAVFIPVLIYALLRRFGWVRFTALALGLALPPLIYAAWFKSESGTFNVTDSQGFILYGRVVSFADCEGVDLPPDQRRFCVTDETRPDDDGVGGVWTSGLPVTALQKEEGANADLMAFGKKMIMNQPFDYLRAVFVDYMQYFTWTSPERRELNAKRWRFVRSLEEAEPHSLVVANEGAPAPESGIDQEFTIRSGGATFLRNYQAVVFSYGPLLALFALAGLAGAVVRRKSPWADVRPEAALFTLCGLALLLLPTLTAVYHFRYVLVGLPLLPAGAALGLSALWSRRTQTDSAPKERALRR